MPEPTKDFQEKLNKLKEGLTRDIPVIVGKLAVDHFKENFHKQGFVNNGLKKWANVKRRDQSSPWYGFEYTGQKRTSVAFTRSKQTGKTQRSAKQKPLNFSSSATTRKVLSSKRMELYNSIRYKTSGGQVVISSDKPYAQLHNEGGTIKVFGKHPVKIPQRQFMGESKELSDKFAEQINVYIHTIFNTK